MTKVQKLFLAMCLLAAPGARAFSLIGPFAPWQVQELSFQWPGVDIGAPMNIGEGFRWNVPVITYACDSSFLNYFGPQGAKAIDEAMAILNDLPPASKISDDLSEYSTQTVREHFEARTLGLIDLKSSALHLIVEELGLADPVRFTFMLRGRAVGNVGGVQFTNYVIGFRNFDPITRQSSRFVNGTLYTYEIQEYALPFQHADAVEFVRDTSLESVPVATGGGRNIVGGPNSSVNFGTFRVGLSRDDVGGLRYLYHTRTYAVETLLPTVSLGNALGAGSTWIPLLTITNVAGVTNTVIVTPPVGTNVIGAGLRGGKNKLRFQRVFFDSLLGQTFTPVTNAYTDVLVSTNNVLIVQPVLRSIGQPDIIFSAGDLGLTAPPAIRTVLSTRTSTAGWIDNDALNGFDEVGVEARGPGVITPSVTISFSDQLPALFDFDTAFLGTGTEDFAFVTGYWGSFDGSTNAPIIYSQSGPLSIQQLRSQILQAPR